MAENSGLAETAALLVAIDFEALAAALIRKGLFVDKISILHHGASVSVEYQKRKKWEPILRAPLTQAQSPDNLAPDSWVTV